MTLERISPDSIHEAAGYTHVVRATGAVVIYVSGQVGIRRDGRVAKGLEAQAIIAFSNLQAALAAAGATTADVAKVTIYVVDFSAEDRAAVLAGRDSVFEPESLPASTLVGVQALARSDLLIEVEAVAMIDS